MKPLLDDPLNRALVALLLEDGRRSHAELAETLGVSRPTVIERVRRLEAAGVISGYTALVSPAAVGKPMTAFVAVRYRPDVDEAAETRFLEAIRAVPDVLEAHTVA